MERPTALSPTVSKNFRETRTRDTGPEIALRRSLYKYGLRYRLQWPVPGKARRTMDIAFPGLKIAVFIDGCYWHGCPQHGEIPKNNRGWWQEKIASNQERDRNTTQHLQHLGWIVLRFWEHQPINEMCEMAIRAVQAQRGIKTLQQVKD